MTLTAVGSLASSAGSLTLAVTPTAVGDVLVLGSADLGGPSPLTAVSGGGVTTWTKLIAYAYSSYEVEIWFGQVTTAGAATITVSATGPPISLAAQQFSAGSPATWAADGSGAGAYHTTALGSYPSVTPSGSGELYLGFAEMTATIGGSTSGFVYTTVNSAQQFVYSLSAPSPSAPAWTSSSYSGNCFVSGLLIATIAALPLAGQIASYTTLTGALSIPGPVPLAGQIASQTTLGATMSPPGNCVPIQSNTQALDGSSSMQMTAATTANMSASSGTYPVSPSTQYTAMASFLALTTGRSCTVSLNWETAAYGAISASTSSAVSDVTSGWVNALVTATSPSNAAFVVITVTVASPSSGETHFVDCVGLFPGTVSVWTRGGLAGLTAQGIILRSDGLYVRNASPANPLALNSVEAGNVYDYEVTPGVAYTYQAQLTDNLGGGFILISALSAPTSPRTVTTTAWWFFNPLAPSTATQAIVQGFAISQYEQSAVHYPIGSGVGVTYPTILSSGFNGQDGVATVKTVSAANLAAIAALLTCGQTVFLSSPFGATYYARIGPQPGGVSGSTGNVAENAALQSSTLANPVNVISLSWVAQPRPSP
jgi:hypothetical protein